MDVLCYGRNAVDLIIILYSDLKEINQGSVGGNVELGGGHVLVFVHQDRSPDGISDIQHFIKRTDLKHLVACGVKFVFQPLHKGLVGGDQAPDLECIVDILVSCQEHKKDQQNEQENISATAIEQNALVKRGVCRGFARQDLAFTLWDGSGHLYIHHLRLQRDGQCYNIFVFRVIFKFIACRKYLDMHAYSQQTGGSGQFQTLHKTLRALVEGSVVDHDLFLQGEFTGALLGQCFGGGYGIRGVVDRLFGVVVNDLQLGIHKVGVLVGHSLGFHIESVVKGCRDTVDKRGNVCLPRGKFVLIVKFVRQQPDLIIHLTRFGIVDITCLIRLVQEHAANAHG